MCYVRAVVAGVVHVHAVVVMRLNSFWPAATASSLELEDDGTDDHAWFGQLGAWDANRMPGTFAARRISFQAKIARVPYTSSPHLAATAGRYFLPDFRFHSPGGTHDAVAACVPAGDLRHTARKSSSCPRVSFGTHGAP
jgi:hypothetical protein